jgi:uncharacterized membrane protein
MSDQPVRWRAVLAVSLARLAEIALALIGLAYVFGPEDAMYKIYLLGLFALVALIYLSVGFWVVRHGRDRPRPDTRPEAAWRPKLRRKFSFLFTVIASLTGLAAASDVLVHPGADERDATVKTLGVFVVFCAWTLLHVGYAAFYRFLDDDESSAVQPGPGLRFIDETRGTTVDYLYFAITLGVSFASSDVEVITRRMRWHVLVHEMVSFFYNAAVLAIAFTVVTNR